MPVPELKPLAPGIRSTWPVLGAKQFYVPCATVLELLCGEETHLACCTAAARLLYVMLVYNTL